MFLQHFYQKYNARIQMLERICPIFITKGQLHNTINDNDMVYQYIAAQKVLNLSLIRICNSSDGFD